MTTQARTFCDYCGEVILEGRNRLVVESGDVRLLMPEIDLCRDHGALLVSWLKSGGPSLGPLASDCRMTTGHTGTPEPSTR